MSCKSQCIVALDMGGTYIKYGLVDDNLSVLCDGSVPADSHDSREVLLDRLSEAIDKGLKAANDNGLFVRGIAISTPGPFDYAAGVSHMVGKYDEIYDIDLRSEFRRRADLPRDLPIEFMQDAAAFLKGEHEIGAAKGYRNCMCVTLGTGTGYACIIENELLLNERKGPYYVLARQPYKNTGKLIEEIVSGGAITKTYGRDAKTLAQKAKSGDNDAINAYFYLGKVLGEALLEVAETKKLNCLVIGGQISRDFDLLYDGILAGLGKLGENITVVPAKNPANAALIGAAVTLF